jgi:hypothetical protein
VAEICPSAPIVERVLRAKARTKTRTALAVRKAKSAVKKARLKKKR